MANKGTKEWADSNINIGLGCANGCLYCYGRSFALLNKKIQKRSDWVNEIILQKEVTKRRYKKPGKRMFPSTHDITPYYLPYATEVLIRMLAAGNDVVVVSKPHFDCISSLCHALEPYKSQLLFRFTIGTLSPAVSKFWEPGAPLPDERIRSLGFAFNRGFRTSVSCEPMLEGVEGILQVIDVVAPLITDDIWVGKMQQPSQRVGVDKPEKILAVDKIKNLQRDAEILRLVSTLRGNPLVKWKDTIQEVIDKVSIEAVLLPT